MPNEEMVKLVKMLDALGYRVVQVGPEKYVQDGFGNEGETLRTVLTITPVEKALR